MNDHRPSQPDPYSLQGLHQGQISAISMPTSTFRHALPHRLLMGLILSILAAWTQTTTVNAQDHQSKKCYIVVRYDDYSPRIPMHQITAGDELETRLFEMFRYHQAKLVVDVIPYPMIDPAAAELDPSTPITPISWLSQPENSWATLLREYVYNGTVEPALHGYEHRRHPPTGYRHGEYRLQPYKWQLESLRQGQQVLSSSLDTHIEVFIPPWNAWDANTARALQELEFTWLSPDLHHAEYSGDTLNIAPQCTANPALALKWMQDDQNLPDQTVMVLVTHPFDFKDEKGKTYFRQLEDLLVFVESSAETSNHWQCVGFTDLPVSNTSSWAQRFRNAVTWDHARRIIHDTFVLSNVVSDQPVFFMPSSYYNSQTWRWQVMIYATMLITACFGGAIAWIASRLVITHRRLLFIVAIVATGLLVYLIWGTIVIVGNGYPVRGIRWQAIAGCAGVMATFWVIWSSRQSTTPKSTTIPQIQDQPSVDAPQSV